MFLARAIKLLNHYTYGITYGIMIYHIIFIHVDSGIADVEWPLYGHFGSFEFVSFSFSFSNLLFSYDQMICQYQDKNVHLNDRITFGRMNFEFSMYYNYRERCAVFEFD
jgi:hypothetical protein